MPWLRSWWSRLGRCSPLLDTAQAAAHSSLARPTKNDHSGRPTVLDTRALYGSGRMAGPVDQATVRRSNLGLVLRHLRDAGPRSRARIALGTGLNKATVSSLVAELIGRGLASEGPVDRVG